MISLSQQIQQAAQLIRAAQHIVALTGAGISTPSGIPDFRSPDSGVWNDANPMEVASIFAFRQNPQPFYDWIRPLAQIIFTAVPNPAHAALVDLERAGKMRAVITQNIDDLHTKAGSEIVHELHGHTRTLTCTRCYTIINAQDILDEFLNEGKAPRHRCGGVLKPDVILFGEQLPAQEFISAQMAMKEADLLLVAGSSLEVAPASDLPLLALDHGASVIVINYGGTYLDPRADVVIQADVAEVLPQIVELALHGASAAAIGESS